MTPTSPPILAAPVAARPFTVCVLTLLALVSWAPSAAARSQDCPGVPASAGVACDAGTVLVYLPDCAPDCWRCVKPSEVPDGAFVVDLDERPDEGGEDHGDGDGDTGHDDGDGGGTAGGGAGGATGGNGTGLGIPAQGDDPRCEPCPPGWTFIHLHGADPEWRCLPPDEEPVVDACCGVGTPVDNNGKCPKGWEVIHLNGCEPEWCCLPPDDDPPHYYVPGSDPDDGAAADCNIVPIALQLDHNNNGEFDNLDWAILWGQPGKLLPRYTTDLNGNQKLDHEDQPPPLETMVPLLVHYAPCLNPDQTWGLMYDDEKIRVYDEQMQVVPAYEVGDPFNNVRSAGPPNSQETLYIQGIELSDSVSDVFLFSVPVYPFPACPDQQPCTEWAGMAHGTVVEVDLDTDSDSDQELEENDEEEEVEGAEGDTERPGKVVRAGTGDEDDDFVPDFADGIDLHGNEGDEAAGAFVPLVLTIPEVIQSQQVKVRLEYEASDPAAVTRSLDDFQDPLYELPAEGDLRVWRKDGPVSRSIRTVDDGGDYVQPGHDYTLQELGGDPARIELFLEPLRESEAPGDRGLEISLIFKDEVVCFDSVRLSVLPRVLLTEQQAEVVDLLGLRIEPAYSDEEDAEGAELAGELFGDDRALFVGLDRPNPHAALHPLRDRELIVLRPEVAPGRFLDVEQSPVMVPVVDDAMENYPGLLPGPFIPPFIKGDPVDWNADDYGELDPDGFEAQFDTALSDLYDHASPSIRWLETEAFELRGLVYGGQSWEWFSGRAVWRDGQKIHVEDSLSPQAAATAYYNYLKDHYGPNVQGISLTPLLRYYGELYQELGESRAKVGEHMAKHWGLVDQLVDDYAGEVYTLGTGFVIDAVMLGRRAKKLRYNPPANAQMSIPLIRRNYIRGNWVEHSIIVDTLGLSRNRSANFNVNIGGGEIIRTKPDAIVSGQAWIEIKDVIELSRTKQLRAQATHTASNDLNYVLICTTRTKRISGPLLTMMAQDGRYLVRRLPNQGEFEVFDFDLWEWFPVTTAEVHQMIQGTI